MGLLDAAISGLASVAGAFIASSASSKAADQESDALDKASRISRESKDAGLGFITQGTDRAVEALGPNFEKGALGTTALRTILARPSNMLSPEQRIQLADIRRSGQANLARSGLRGAGRAGVAVINDLERRTIAGFGSENRDRQQRVGEIFERRGGEAAVGEANFRANEGVAKGNIEVEVGTQIARNAAEAGQAQAAATTASGGILSSSLGTIGGIISDEVKAADQRNTKVLTQSSLFDN